MESILNEEKEMLDLELRIDGYNVPIFKDGTIGLPEGYNVIGFNLENKSSDRIRFVHNQKRHPNFLEAIKDAIKKLNNKSMGYRYEIVITYQKDFKGWSQDSFCYVKKTEEGYKILDRNWSKTNIIDVPTKWLPKSRKSDEIESLHKVLKEKYNVNEVVYLNAINNERKKKFLNQIIAYFNSLEGIVDFFALNPICIKTSNMKKWGGKYFENTLMLREYGLSSFYHEYFHHIDLSTNRLRKYHYDDEKKEYIEETKAGIIYDKMCCNLLKDPTLTRFKEMNKHILNEHGNLKDSQWNTKKGRWYIYWLENCEITARLFEDCIHHLVNEKLNDEYKLYGEHFTPQEVEENKQLLFDFINEVCKLSKEKKESIV